TALRRGLARLGITPIGGSLFAGLARILALSFGELRFDAGAGALTAIVMAIEIGLITAAGVGRLAAALLLLPVAVVAGVAALPARQGVSGLVVLVAIVVTVDRLGLRHLRLRRRDDAVVMLGVLEIVFAGDPVAARLRIAR